jgi:uncharacterized protein
LVIYLDSAAIVKLIHREPESDALDLWLAERLGQPRVTSALAEVEVARAILRMAPASQPKILAVLGTIGRFEIGPAVRGLAASYTDSALRSLDAIHLATAQVLAAELSGSPITFATYDKRLLAVAGKAALTIASPGM